MAWTTLPSIYSSIYGMDRYAEWVLVYGWDEYARGDEGSDGPRIPFIIEILSKPAREVVQYYKDNKSPSIEIYELNPDIEVGSHIAGWAHLSFFENLANALPDLHKKLHDANKRIRLSLPLKSRCEQHNGLALSDPAGGALGGPPFLSKTVIVGIIDDGIAFANDRFLADPHKTRIAYFWRQDGDFNKKAIVGTPKVSASAVPYGIEIAATDKGSSLGIDNLLKKHAKNGVVDEDQVYAEFGTMDFRNPRDHKPVAQRRAHGTHVLDLAAGYPMEENCQVRPIIAVQLPIATTADTSGSTLEFYAKHAIDYLFERSALLDKDEQIPLVVNFSYGFTAGPHDGASVMEQVIEKALKRPGRPTTFVLPAGNAHLSRAHARVRWDGAADTPQDNPATLHWRLQPNNLATSHLEIWLPNAKTSGDDRVLLEVIAPDGQSSGPIGEDPLETHVLFTNDCKALALATYWEEAPPVADAKAAEEAAAAGKAAPIRRGVFLISVRPTEHLRPSAKPDAPAGVWEVLIHKGNGYTNETVEAWIQRDDTPFGYPIRARQSYFDDPNYQVSDATCGRPLEDDPVAGPPSHVKRVSLINAIATGCGPVVVGGFFRKEICSSEYSAGGPTDTPQPTGALRREAPDVIAVSDDSRIHRGVLGAGSRSGSAFAMSGTSVSSPQIAKVAAELATSGAVDRKRIRDEADAADVKDPRREGCGRILIPSDRPKRID